MSISPPSRFRNLIKNTNYFILILFASLFLSACGGSSDGGTVNAAPTFTSATTANLAENSTAVMTVAATDADGDSLTYSLSGGADQTAFAIDGASGVLTFNAAPNFEAPADANSDNVYEVQVSVNDGSDTIAQTVNVTVTDLLEMGGSIQGTPLSLTTTVTTLAGTLSSGSTDGTGAAAQFWGPIGITTDGFNLYVTDFANHTIRQIVISTGVVTTLAGTASSSGSTDGTGAAAQFYYPSGITTDGVNLYVTEFNHTIRQIVIATGVVTTLAGSAGLSGFTDGTGAAAQFNNPYGITTDGTNLYVADDRNHSIRQVVISTGVVTTLAGTASSSGSTDGTGAAAQFTFPRGITTDGVNLYVADTINQTIRQIVISTRVVTTLVGTVGIIGSTDGTGAAAQFNYPYGITTDGTNLYVADDRNHTIRQIVISTGVVTTLAGTAPSSGSTDGTGAAAQFNNPSGITTDGFNLYVADFTNSTIRQIQ